MSKVILGGGISGLSSAYYLSKKIPSQPITIIESSNRLGGWIKTRLLNDDIIFEQGPRTIRPHGAAGANTLFLIEELELDKYIVPIFSSHPAAKNRMIYVKGRLHTLPSSVFSIFKVQSPFSRPLITYLAKDIFTPKKSIKDESIYDFVCRRFGKEIADYLISSLICGICAGNSKEISVNFLLKNLFEYEQKYGSITKGLVNNLFKINERKTELSGLALRAYNERWNVYSLKNGLETFPKALINYLKQQNVQIELNSKCRMLEFADGNVTLHFENGRKLITKHVISSVPSEQLGELISTQHPNLSDMLCKIKRVTVGVVNLHYNKQVISNNGFGFLVPPIERLPLLGVIYDSCCFPKGDNTILTVMMGGHWFEEFFGKNPSEDLLLCTAKQQLKQILGIFEEPFQFKVSILTKCIPQYIIGHNENLEKINGYISKNNLPLSLCGASYYGVGINDVILSSKNAIDKL